MTHADRKHARFAPSAAHRWVNCPGSVSLSEQFPNKSSPAADEGTAAHQMADRCLNKGWDAADHYTTDNTIKVRAGADIKVTEDMIEGVQLYLDYVRGIFDQCDEFAIEARLDMSHIHPEFFGTGDAIGFDASSGTIHVVDFKYGRKPVNPENNWQGIAYAIGATRKWPNADRVLIHIVQPRVSRTPVSWATTSHDRLTLKVREAILQATGKNPVFVAGDWCEYCPAAAICPTLKSKAIAVAKDEFGIIPEPRDIPDLSKVLSNLDVLEDWCKRVREHAFELATNGQKIAGFKLVQRRAVRKWANPDPDVTGAKLVHEFRLPVMEVLEHKVRSPAQIEKLLDKDGKKALAELVVKASSGITLVPESDRRPAVSPDAALEFSKVELDDG